LSRRRRWGFRPSRGKPAARARVRARLIGGKLTFTGSRTSAALVCSRRRPSGRACQYRHGQGLAQVGAQEPSARRSARLVGVAAQRQVPRVHSPEQAAPSEPWGNKVGQDSIGGHPIKADQNSTGVDNKPNSIAGAACGRGS
jgi:hypothetical protein